MTTHMGVRAILSGALIGAAWVAVSALELEDPGAQRPAGQVAYDASGSGDPVVLVHGFTLDRHMWDGQVPVLARDHYVIRFDLRGHGDSPRIDRPYTGFGDLEALLDSLHIDRASLVGLSAGAELAINFTIAHPDRVSRLVLASPGLGGFRGASMPWMRPVLEAAAAGDGEAAARLWLQTPLMRAPTAEVAAAVSRMVMRNADLWTSPRVEQPLVPPAIERLASIRCSVLIVLGEQDEPTTRDIARTIKQGVPQAEIVTLGGAGHLVNMHAPSAFNGLVARFLASQP